MTTGSSAQTVDQLFQQKKLYQWWKYPTQRFGQNKGGFGAEQGTDFSAPLNTPVGSISAGKVVYVGKGGYNDPSLGTIVQVQQTDGSIYHYQHLNGSNLRVGQTINPGDLIGVSGGPPGKFSNGPHIEVRYSRTYRSNAGVWSQQWVDPYTQITGAATGVNSGVGAGPSGTASSAGSTTSPAALTIGPSFQFPQIQLSPTADVTKVLWSIDQILQIVPPWNVVTTRDVTIGGLDTGLIDPISWFEGFLFNLGADGLAIILRAMFLFWGAFLFYKVLSTFIDFGAIAQNTANTGFAALKLGLALA